jgi:FKBP-type peptidyl-prolyl cis-trans isomerase FkpA
MKKIVLASLVLASVLTGCLKESKVDCSNIEVKAPDSEIATLTAYIEENGIEATKDPRGFFYRIITAGGAEKPTPCSVVTVNYIGKLTNGTVFDQNDNIRFPLSNLILGWQEGIPLIGAGGSIILYLPPSLAYGSSAVGSIPANSILVFNIELKGIN